MSVDDFVAACGDNVLSLKPLQNFRKKIGNCKTDDMRFDPKWLEYFLENVDDSPPNPDSLYKID